MQGLNHEEKMKKMCDLVYVGETGLEPAASRTRIARSKPSELLPVVKVKDYYTRTFLILGIGTILVPISMHSKVDNKKAARSRRARRAERTRAAIYKLAIVLLVAVNCRFNAPRKTSPIYFSSTAYKLYGDLGLKEVRITIRLPSGQG